MDIFKPDFKTQYELARQIGDRRFGSPCSHDQVKNGHCMKCLRKVVQKKGRSQ